MHPLNDWTEPLPHIIPIASVKVMVVEMVSNHSPRLIKRLHFFKMEINLNLRPRLQPFRVAIFPTILAHAEQVDPAAFKEMTGGEKSTQKGWIKVDHSRYEWIVEMRDEIRKLRRQRGSS